MTQMSFDAPRTNPPIFVGGIDPGSAMAGYALLMCGKYHGPTEVLDLGVLAKPNGGSISEVFDNWYTIATAVRGTPALWLSIAVEGQWVPQVDGKLARNAKQLKKIMGQINATVEVAANRGAWLGIAGARGWEGTKLHPSKWRSVLGRAPHHAARRKPIKARAIELVRLREAQLFKRIKPPRRLPDHVAEAILIGDYHATTIQQDHLLHNGA